MDIPEILYEDNHIIAVNKRAGDLSQDDATGADPLQTLIKDFIKRRDAKPGNVYLGTIHRLDKPVSGVLLFAKTSKAAERLSSMVKNRSIEKYYLAVTPALKGDHPGEWIPCEDMIVRRGDRTFIANGNEPGAQSAKLSMSVVASNGSLSLRLIDLHTGRKHQIRAQLSSRNATIAGDRRYGSRVEWQTDSIALHACMARFIHPVKKEPVEIFAPLPEYFMSRAKETGLIKSEQSLASEIRRLADTEKE
jgi:23S rRNA pseudouridine1911/1915/1917 synthase